MKNSERKKETNMTSARRAGVLLRALDLPEKTSSSLPCIELAGDSRLSVENYKGVLELGESVIRLYTELGVLRIEGRELSIRNADMQSALIDGRIFSIEYEDLANQSEKG